MKPRAVFDCMIFLQGAGRPGGPAGECLRLVDEQQVTLCISAEILAEIHDVLSRPEVRRRFPGLSADWVETFVRRIALNAAWFTDVPHTVPLERDPKDEPYLNLALAADARYLVSRDRDLLDLMNDAGFCRRFPALSVLEPPAFLVEIARHSQTDEGQVE
jgi:putative PIN family toxin of toxin-antitoxin system